MIPSSVHLCRSKPSACCRNGEREEACRQHGLEALHTGMVFRIVVFLQIHVMNMQSYLGLIL